MTAVLLLPVLSFTFLSNNGRSLLSNAIEALTYGEDDDMDNWYFPNSQLLEYIVDSSNMYGFWGSFGVDPGGQYSLVFHNTLYVFWLSQTFEYDPIYCCGPGSGDCSFSVSYGSLTPTPGKCAKFHQGYQFWDYDFLEDHGRNHMGYPIRP